MKAAVVFCVLCFISITKGTSASTGDECVTESQVASTYPTDSHAFDAEVYVEYPLKKPLQEGDVIRAWGVYKDDATSKFSVNIRGSSTLYHIHVDFRPMYDVVVLNNNNNGWKSEVRPWLSRDKFKANTLFEVRVEVKADEYWIFLNGEKLSKTFPHREDLSTANHVVLHGGSNGFKWTALQLPKELLAGPKIPFDTSSGNKNFLETPLVVGDVITAWGIYATASSKFNVNLMMENGQYFMIHVDFRPPPNENKVVLNSKKQNGWETEIRTTLPTFENGKVFKVDVKCLDGEFEIYHNDKVLEPRFPYRDGFNLEDVKFIWLLGGSEGMVWTDLALPRGSFKLEGISSSEQELMSGTELLQLVTASQSSTRKDTLPAKNAIDGNTNTNMAAKSCTETDSQATNWWMATLAENSAVSMVVIYNSNEGHVKGAKVYVGDVFCGKASYEIPGKATYPVACGNNVGGTVKIVQDDRALSLCEVQVLGVPSDETPLVNIAPGFPTWQNSEGWNGSPDRATDGRYTGTYKSNSCTHSGSKDFNMWKVDLIDKYKINRVVIYNRVDSCCSKRLDGAQVFVNNKICGAVEYEAGKDVYILDCGDQVGSVIKITQEGKHLTLCEVEVLARVSEKEGKLKNVASSGVATHDSTSDDGVASLAIDGIVSGMFNETKSCSHSGDTKDGWWNLEFPEPTPVEKVVIYNREDCCQDHIDDVKVYADGELCGTIKYVEGQRVYTTSCRSNSTEYRMATNIRITVPDGTFLTLCEVQVLSDPDALSVDNLVNLAYNKPTSQSSTYKDGVSSRAVDGKESGKWSSKTCSHTSGPGEWKVDLGDNYSVEKIWIRNRIDCCSERLDGVKVYVGDILCGTVVYDRLKYTYELICGEGIIGDSVTIKNNRESLTLCEVKVYGDGTPVTGLADEEVVGDISGKKDDANSTATCPSGFVVKYCEAKTGGVHDECDGVFVKPSKPNVCVAVNGVKGNGAVARAVCTQLQQVPDPCNGPKILKYKNLNSEGANPSLECPAGYEQILCNARSPWRGRLTGKGVDEKGIIANDKACAVSGCTDRYWCEVTAVCQPIDDREAYAAAVCSTCDGYHCGDGEECVMMDMDDDPTDKQTPTCVVKETGCDDNDRCGDDGVCVAVGSEDYKCECGAGFEFSTVTGSCIPVHTIWSTVFGEPAVGDDAISYAECGEGDIVMRCYTHGAPSAADGVYIESGDDGLFKCIARASYRRKYPIIAIAYCGARATMTDPCTQEKIHSVEYRFSSAHSPSISCPSGYYMDSCIFHSPWTQNMNDAARKLVNSIGSVAVDDDGSCSIDKCLKKETKRNFCRLTAICTKLTGDKYIKDACPTCDQVKCPDGQVCDMVRELPLCQPRIPGGCETDNCGAGKCVEDGPNYTCECDSGYKFDEVTCVDVDECQEEPCGNGECSNLPGSYRCECKEGYYEDEGTCKDVDECAREPCSDTERCSNVEGSYICDCLDTFIRDPKSDDCVCADGFEAVDDVCTDIDECAGESPCGQNEACFNTVGSHYCECEDEFERGMDGVCKNFASGDCDVKPKDDNIKAMTGKRVQVKLIGEVKKTWKKYADIVWLKNNEVWDPSADGKEKFNGFTIRNFQAEDAGIYVGNIYIEMSEEENYKCFVTVSISLEEGSASIDIEDREKLAATQKVGKGMSIICDVQLTNVKLDDKNNPNNVNWYKVNQETGEDMKIEDSDSIEIKKNKGTYRLYFVNPQPADSGTYKCEFSQQGVQVSTDISVVWA